MDSVSDDSDGTDGRAKDDLDHAENCIHNDSEGSGQLRVTAPDLRIPDILVVFDELFPDPGFHRAFFLPFPYVCFNSF